MSEPTQTNASTEENQQSQQRQQRRGKKDDDKKRSKYNDTGLHVLKGAIVSVLGLDAAVTTTVEFEHPCKASIQVTWPGETLPPETISLIEQKANEKIQENVPVCVHTMSRVEAEQHYAQKYKFPLYDKYPVPPEVTELQVVDIEGWNVNSCSGTHCTTTGELKALCILKTKRRANTQTYDFQFNVHDTALEYKAKLEKQEQQAAGLKHSAASKTEDKKTEATTDKKTTKDTNTATQKDNVKTTTAVSNNDTKAASTTTAAAAQVDVKGTIFEGWKPSQTSTIDQDVDELLDLVVAPKVKQLFSTKVADNVDMDKVTQQLKLSLESEVRSFLVMRHNLSYTQGYNSHLKQNKFNIL